MKQRSDLLFAKTHSSSGPVRLFGPPGFEPGNGGIEIQVVRTIYQCAFRKNTEIRLLSDQEVSEHFGMPGSTLRTLAATRGVTYLGTGTLPRGLAMGTSPRVNRLVPNEALHWPAIEYSPFDGDREGVCAGIQVGSALAMSNYLDIVESVCGTRAAAGGGLLDGAIYLGDPAIDICQDAGLDLDPGIDVGAAARYRDVTLDLVSDVRLGQEPIGAD